MPPALLLFVCGSTALLLDQGSKRLALARPSRSDGARAARMFLRVRLNAAAPMRGNGGTAGLAVLWGVNAAVCLALAGRVPGPGAAVVSAGAGLALGGAAGNLVDRLTRGGVIDFIAVGWWPVFNLADVAIVVGALAGIAAVVLSSLG